MHFTGVVQPHARGVNVLAAVAGDDDVVALRVPGQHIAHVQGGGIFGGRGEALHQIAGSIALLYARAGDAEIQIGEGGKVALVKLTSAKPLY